MARGDTTRPHFSPSTSRCAPPSREPVCTSSSASGQRRSSPLGSTLAQWHIPTALLLHFTFSHAPGTRTASCPEAFSSLSKNILLYEPTGAQQWAPRLTERGRHPLQGDNRTGLGQTPPGFWDVGSNSTSPGWDDALNASLTCTAGAKLLCENVSILTVPSCCQASSSELDEAWVSDPSFSSWRVKRKKFCPLFLCWRAGDPQTAVVKGRG